MPRPPRLQFPGAICHIVMRGDGRRTLFHDELFDQEFHEQLATDWRPETSRRFAIEHLKHLIAQLEAQMPQA